MLGAGQSLTYIVDFISSVCYLTHDTYNISHIHGGGRRRSRTLPRWTRWRAWRRRCAPATCPASWRPPPWAPTASTATRAARRPPWTRAEGPPPGPPSGRRGGRHGRGLKGPPLVPPAGGAAAAMDEGWRAPPWSPQCGLAAPAPGSRRAAGAQRGFRAGTRPAWRGDVLRVCACGEVGPVCACMHASGLCCVWCLSMLSKRVLPCACWRARRLLSCGHLGGHVRSCCGSETRRCNQEVAGPQWQKGDVQHCPTQRMNE